jgi:drug/metabolite transporter superfamily protein YnfA
MRRTKKQHVVMMFFLAASLSALVGVVEILVSRLAGPVFLALGAMFLCLAAMWVAIGVRFRRKLSA